MLKRGVFLVVLVGLLALVAGAGVINSSYFTVTHTIVRTGDSAMAMEITPTTAMDSFVYIDTLVYNHSLTDSTEVTWTSPLHYVEITPGVEDSYDYVCSVLFASTDKLGVTWTSPAANTTIDTVLDSMVHYINNATNLKDSVVASEDGAKLTITAKFGTEAHGGRWDLSDLCDSLGDTTHYRTSVAMVCDSMVAALNLTACSTLLTATDSTTTWYIQGDVAGMAFDFYVGDSATDTSTTQDTVTSFSTGAYDTLGLFSMSSPNQYNSLYGDIILYPSNTTDSGYGLDDTAYLVLKSVFGGSYLTLDSNKSVGLPCTLHVAIGPDTTGGGVDPDTLWRENLVVISHVVDSCTVRSAGPYDHEIWYRFIRR